jgi:glucans biosynthesis protein
MTIGLIALIGHARAQEKTAPSSAEGAKRFSFADVRQRAAELANRPFEEPKNDLPPALRGLTYDQYRYIHFRRKKALWRDEGLPFQVQFFHRAFLSYMASPLDKIVAYTIDEGRVDTVRYSSDLFNFGDLAISDLPSNLGFAGFRILYPLNREDKDDEIVVFMGASYFRALGQNQHYGLSARGLAIDTGLSKAEEFPRFREFWLEKPARDATEIKVYALMDSKSATGAYQFTIRPGRETVIEVEANVFMRTDVEKIGFAPLTSMFFRGEGSSRFLDDFRPEVHDSDGLLLATGHGEWLWRPLVNPTTLRVSSFSDINPRGFGLLQRDRHFDHYQDLESVYEMRPSVWIEPLGDWGKGVVQLVEIPSDADWYDNIVAFWWPDAPAKAGKVWRFAYRMSFFLDKPGLPPGGKTDATRIGRGGAGGEITPGKRKFVIDFVGGQLQALSTEAPVEAVITVSSGQVDHKAVQRNDFIHGWRVFFELKSDDDTPVELRCFLKLGEDILTETWSYQWHPN